jgi:hypothetical protein
MPQERVNDDDKTLGRFPLGNLPGKKEVIVSISLKTPNFLLGSGITYI